MIMSIQIHRSHRYIILLRSLRFTSEIAGYTRHFRTLLSQRQTNMVIHTSRFCDVR